VPESRSLPARVGRTWQNVRTKGTWSVVRALLGRLGIRITPFYWVKETLPPEIPAHLTALPEGFSCRELEHAEIAALEHYHDGQEGVNQHRMLQDVASRGYRCLGILRDGEIMAFTSFSTDVSLSRFHPVALAPNEAYLFNMYVLTAARGHNLAGILRYRNYEVLRDLGRDTFYSITVASNTASWRFKEKLKARKVFFGLYVDLFGVWVLRPVLRRY
jgi:hypothetical protein